MPGYKDPPKEYQFKPGNPGGGKPKGTKSLATIVRQLEHEDFDWKHVPIKNKEAVAQMGSPWKAIVYVALGQAISGDHSAREWLRKAGYGDKLDLTTLGKELPQPILGGISAIHRDNSNSKDQPANQES